jgi:hypothetical protein
MRQNGLEAAVRRLWEQEIPILGVCGGYQMLGRRLSDPEGAESGGEMAGMGLLPADTRFARRKTTVQTEATVSARPFAGAKLRGYQIHMGRTETEAEPFCILPDGTAYLAGSPTGTKRRYPLAVLFSEDGVCFDKAILLRSGGTDLQPQRYPGKAKTLGYNYPKSMVYNGKLYVAYTTNKEDVECTIINIKTKQR